MGELKFVECRNCGCIHYVINKERVKALKKTFISSGFSSRDLTCCFECGSKNNFSIMSEYYVTFYGTTDRIPPVYLDYGKLERTMQNKS